MGEGRRTSAREVDDVGDGCDEGGVRGERGGAESDGRCSVGAMSNGSDGRGIRAPLAKRGARDVDVAVSGRMRWEPLVRCLSMLCLPPRLNTRAALMRPYPPIVPLPDCPSEA